MRSAARFSAASASSNEGLMYRSVTSASECPRTMPATALEATASRAVAHVFRRLWKVGKRSPAFGFGQTALTALERLPLMLRSLSPSGPRNTGSAGAGCAGRIRASNSRARSDSGTSRALKFLATSAETLKDFPSRSTCPRVRAEGTRRPHVVRELAVHLHEVLGDIPAGGRGLVRKLREPGRLQRAAPGPSTRAIAERPLRQGSHYTTGPHRLRQRLEPAGARRLRH